jgi:hypothetical protein
MIAFSVRGILAGALSFFFLVLTQIYWFVDSAVTYWLFETVYKIALEAYLFMGFDDGYLQYVSGLIHEKGK